MSATSHQQKAHGRSQQQKGRKWKRTEKRQEKKKNIYIYIYTFYLAHFISFTLATWWEKLTHWKRLWCWERLRAGEGDDRGRDGWKASPTQWTELGQTPGAGERQGSLACCSPQGRKESDTTDQLNQIEYKVKLPGFKSPANHSPRVWPRTSYSTLLCLSFPFYKIKLLTSKDPHKDSVGQHMWGISSWVCISSVCMHSRI